jgi:uncharacterized protein YndB with AHSA1/START domain
MRSVVHASFTITRRWDASPARVFAAFADEQQKAKWFARGEGLELVSRSFDFRVGGKENASGRWKTGMVSHFDAVYHDIVPDQRIIYSYVMHLDDRKISVSQACIEIMPDGEGARLVLTEHGDFREHGTNFLIDALEKSLAD